MKQLRPKHLVALVFAVALVIDIAWAAANSTSAPKLEAKPALSDLAHELPPKGDFVGAKKCAECHQAHVDGWMNTAHNKMIRRPTTDGPHPTVLADFSIPSEHRKFELKDVRWVIGSRWKQRFIGEVDGKEVVFPAQWSVKDKKWMPYTAKTDWWWEQHQDWKQRSNFHLCAGESNRQKG